MGLVSQLRANLRSGRMLYQRLRDRGHGRVGTVVWRLPQAVAVRAYRKLAYAINDGVLQRWVTPGRFRRFQNGLADCLGGHFYVIVMPHTLHFLLPCLRLVNNDLRVILLLNGARRWEADLLRAHWPHLPQFRVATMPNSSAGHGSMINMLLRHNQRDFGLLDHDLYLFDKTVLTRLLFADEEFLLCLLSDASADGKWVYPLTHFLYFRVEVFRRLMETYGVGAQSYRQIPEPARSRLAALGLSDGATMKSYHDFYDTLHVLLALAYAEGFSLGQIELATDDGVYHVGGTSIGTHHTKDLAHLYIQLRFLELAGEPQLRRRYAALTAPFTSASELRKLLPETPQTMHQMLVVDRLINRLQRALAREKSAASR
jgi:hypothetical protein